MTVSVIIPTYNGRHKVDGLIQSLEKQTYASFEVLLVIDGSTDGTATAFKNRNPALSSFRIIEQENKGRSAVRNRGAAEATGDLLIFFDDDMLPKEDCISGHVNHHLSHRESVLTGGLGEDVNSDSLDIFKFKSYLSTKWNNSLKTDEEGRLLKSSIFITAANFSISKDIFDRLKGFDERLKDAEDFDLAVRAYKAGIPLYFKSNVFAWHNDKITCHSYIKRQRQYAVAHRILTDLKPWLSEEGYIKTPEHLAGWKKKVFLLFLNEIWITAVDKNRFIFLPKPLRYKLYDLIITANGIFYPNKVVLS